MLYAFAAMNRDKIFTKNRKQFNHFLTLNQQYCRPLILQCTRSFTKTKTKKKTSSFLFAFLINTPNLPETLCVCRQFKMFLNYAYQ